MSDLISQEMMMKKACLALLGLSAFTLLHSKQSYTLNGDVILVNFDVATNFDDPKSPAYWQMFFEQSSERLFNATDGHMRLGKINFFNNNSLENADVNIYYDPTNALVSNASFSGYLNLNWWGETINIHPNPVGRPDGTPSSIDLYLHQIERSGPAVFIHELGHYVLALGDLYFGHFWDSEADYDAEFPGTYPFANNRLGKFHRSNGITLEDGVTKFTKTLEGTDPNEFSNCRNDEGLASIMSTTYNSSVNWDDDQENGGAKVGEFCLPQHYFYGKLGEDLDHDGDPDFVVLNHNSYWAYLDESPWESVVRLIEYIEPTIPINVPQVPDYKMPPGYENIEFNYFSNKNTMVLVYDISQSMKGQKIDGAIEAGITYAGHLREESNVGLKVGLVSYHSVAKTQIPLTELTSENIKGVADDYETVINSLDGQVGGNTGIGNGLSQLMSVITSLKQDGVLSAILMSDGLHNIGPAPEDFYDELKDLGVKVYAIGYGDDADEVLLANIAYVTGGVYAHADDGHALADIFTGNLLSSGRENAAQSQESNVDVGSITNQNVAVAENGSSKRLVITTRNNPEDIKVKLVSPSGIEFIEESGRGVKYYSRGLAKTFKLDPLVTESGEWIIRIENLGNSPINYRYVEYVDDSESKIAMIASTEKLHYEINEPLWIKASLKKSSFLTKTPMVAEIYGPSGEYLGVITLNDDGVNGDLIKGDGIYSNNQFKGYSAVGSYKIKVIGKGIAGESHTIVREHDHEDGNYQSHSDVRYLTESFIRTKSFGVVVGNPKENEQIIEVGSCSLPQGGTGAQSLNGPFAVTFQPGDKIYVKGDGAEYAIPITQFDSPSFWVGFWQYPYMGSGTSNGVCSIVRNAPHGKSSFVCEDECLGAKNIQAGYRATFNSLGEKWYKVTGLVSGWQASEMQGRTITVNGVEVQPGEFPLPESVDGVYYFYFSEGEKSWASWSLW